MATKKEFATLYLATKGVTTSGSSVEKTVTKKEAQQELAKNLLTTLRKVYAQLELAKQANLLTEKGAKKIVELAQNSSLEEYDTIKKAMINTIKKGLKAAKKEDITFGVSVTDEINDILDDDDDDDDKE